MEEVEGEKKSAAGEEGEGDDDEDAGGVENIDGGDFALLLNEAHPCNADAVHLFLQNDTSCCERHNGGGVAREGGCG
jgi:hypothetical protein